MPDTALLVIDMQRALLKDAHDGDACLGRVAELADRARAAGVPVVYLRQQFDQVPAEWLEVHPTLTPQPGDVVLDKDSADSFLGTALGEVLAELAVHRLVVTGYASDYCVDSTSRSALSHGYDLVLVADGHTTMERPAGDPAHGRTDRRAPQRDLLGHPVRGQVGHRRPGGGDPFRRLTRELNGRLRPRCSIPAAAHRRRRRRRSRPLGRCCAPRRPGSGGTPPRG